MPNSLTFTHMRQLHIISTDWKVGIDNQTTHIQRFLNATNLSNWPDNGPCSNGLQYQPNAATTGLFCGKNDYLLHLLKCLLHNLKSEKQSSRPCVLVPAIGRSSPVVGCTCWWPAVLYGNGVSGTQSPLCSSSTLACCDRGSLNRGPVCPFMSGTCVLSLCC